MSATTTPDTSNPPDGIEGRSETINEPDGNVTLNITVTQQDPELRAIEAILVILQMLPYDTRVRAMTYIRDRTESDPGVWGRNPERGTRAAPVTRYEVAQILAESDGRDWHAMSPDHQSPYYRRAEALTSVGFAVMRES